VKSVRDILQVGQLAAPLALGSIAQAVNELVDRIFLGSFSQDALAAVVPSGMISATFCVFLSNTIGYSGAVMARRLGANDRIGAETALFQGVWLTILALPLVLLAWPAGRELLTAAGHAEEVFALEKSYFDYALLAGTVGILTTVLSGYLSARKRMSLVCMALTAGSAANILLDWLLIPSIGIDGAGIGLVAASVASCSLLAFAAHFDPERTRTEINCRRFNRKLAIDIVRQGLPFGISAVVGAGTFALFTLCLGRFSAGLLAAANAVFATHGILYFVVCAIESAVLVLVGRACGKRNADEMRNHARAGAVLAFLCVIAFYASLAPFSDIVLGWFAPAESHDFRHFAGIFLMSMVIRDLFEALQRVYTGALRAIGRTSDILIAHTIYSFAVWAPLFLLTTHLKWPLVTWQTMTVACAVHALILYRIWHAAIARTTLFQLN